MPSINRVRFASLNISIIVLLLLVFTTHSNGQTTQSTTDKMTPSGIQPGAPAGSYRRLSRPRHRMSVGPTRLEFP